MRNSTHLHILASVGRKNLRPLHEIPTAQQAGRSFYDWQRSRGYKSLKDIKSLIGGPPLIRRTGRLPKAGPFGDHFGATPMYRISTPEHVAWFVLRVPPEASASFRKKAKSMYATFLHYCYSQGWITGDVLVAADSMDVGDLAEDKRWLTPEQLAIFDRVVATCESLDAYERFVWVTYRDTGIRTFEGRELTPQSLDLARQKPGVLRLLHGKGRGNGKERDIPVAEAYIDSFLAHVQRHHLRPGQPVLFQRRWLLLKGEKDVMGWVDDHSAAASSKAINGVFRRIQEQVSQLVDAKEISARKVPLWPLTAKVMRKTYACNQLILSRYGLGGMDLVQLQEALGHSSLTTTKTYLADVNQYLGQTIDRVSTGDAAAMILAKKKRDKKRDKKRASAS